MSSTNHVQERYAAGATRLSGLARVAGRTVSALVVCSPLFLARRPKTPLRVFCIAAFELFARLRGGTLGKQRRLAMAHACDFGSLRDDYYDDRRLDVAEYRALRRTLRLMAPEAATSRYIREVRQTERCRPVPGAGKPEFVDAVIAYRKRVLDLTLRWLQEISGLSVEELKFDALLSLGCLMQIADDVLDREEDQALALPSYVTALVHEPPVRAQADALLHRIVSAARQDADSLPLAIAGVLTWTFVIALLRLRLPR